LPAGGDERPEKPAPGGFRGRLIAAADEKKRPLLRPVSDRGQDRINPGTEAERVFRTDIEMVVQNLRVMEIADRPAGEFLRNKADQVRLRAVGAEGGGCFFPQFGQNGGRRGIFRLGEDGDKITAAPELEKPAFIEASLAEAPILPLEVVGEHAEGVGRRTHVEEVDDDVGLAGLVKAAARQEPHVERPVDFAGAVDVFENGFPVEDPVLPAGRPAEGFAGKKRQEPGGLGG